MSKIPKQYKQYQQLNTRLAKYMASVERIYEAMNLEAAKAAARTNYSPDSNKPFRWADYPQTKKIISDIQSQFVNEIGTLIYRGTADEWKKSNEAQDLLANGFLKAYNVKERSVKYKKYYQTNSDAKKAFQNRKDRGMNLSTKLWKQSSDYVRGLEAAISCAVEKGTSAVELSKNVTKYLRDFESLKSDYKNKYSKADDLKDCEYRSLRLARSEINMSYRTAENERWKQMDFVVGYEIKLSSVHYEHMPHGDICDTLAGKYPKDFVWTGWHPNDMCYKIPILNTEEEFWDSIRKGKDSEESVNEVKDVPDAFKNWIEDNTQRIEDAKERGTTPYFVQDNQRVVDNLIHT